MPQLARGGKHVFGWTLVRPDGSLRLPPDVVQEYAMPDGGQVVLLSGSRTSGGMRVATIGEIAGSVFAGALDVARPDDAERFKGALAATAGIERGVVAPSRAVLRAFGVEPGARLLAIRGSYVAVVLAIRGPLVERALGHPELTMWK